MGCFSGSSDGKASACNAEDLGLIPSSGRHPGEGNDNGVYVCVCALTFLFPLEAAVQENVQFWLIVVKH